MVGYDGGNYLPTHARKSFHSNFYKALPSYKGIDTVWFDPYDRSSIMHIHAQLETSTETFQDKEKKSSIEMYSTELIQNSVAYNSEK